ncbi:membrane protein [Glaciihabitans tibetensis]|uniref:Membrane protein n=1 Tax=Glaciihabitans tibetensis TaxID=1266600 RepID=A0A2T0VII1_9MICO|nr:YihY/virulence factor BrkB family protein [Glaciihabitans tibetensis]PRY70039.1 membrane protein [Glaciihabitans tibetensis]
MSERASERERTAPDPEDSRKPDSPTDLTKRSWKYILRKTMREFTSDQCTDLAAALTYYGTLALFPALLAFVSILGLVSDAEKTTNALLDLLGGLVPQDTLDIIKEPIQNLTQSPSAGLALVIGIVGALWSASGFVGAFSRAMNRIYSIEEGRPFWKLRPVILLVTVIAIVCAVIAAVLLVISGPIAEQIGSLLGLGETAVFVWNIVRWPLLAALAVVIMAILYYATPNVRQPKFRWMSMGALVALLIWVLASAAFGFYVVNFSSYNETYGSIGSIIVFLLWVWISNIALLFGAEIDAEIERGRQLQAGIAAEEHIQLPPRDTKVSDKKAEQQAKDTRDGLRIRINSERAAVRRAEQEARKEDEKQ